MYVSEICAEGIFLTFPWWLKNGKSRSKIALFSNERHFEIWFPKKRTITFSWSKLSKLHKKDPILYVATTFTLKQGETRTSHGPIPHPLTQRNSLDWDLYTIRKRINILVGKFWRENSSKPLKNKTNKQKRGVGGLTSPLQVGAYSLYFIHGSKQTSMISFFLAGPKFAIM